MDVKLGAAINVDLTLEQTMADAKVKLVFLDACRATRLPQKFVPPRRRAACRYSQVLPR